MPAVSARPALIEDLPAIVGLLADDVLGQSRENIGPPLHSDYFDAFEAIGSKKLNSNKCGSRCKKHSPQNNMRQRCLPRTIHKVFNSEKHYWCMARLPLGRTYHPGFVKIFTQRSKVSGMKLLGTEVDTHS